MLPYLYLFLSVFFSAFITVAFKFAAKLHINLFQAIVVNYLVCITTAIAVNGGLSIPYMVTNKPWFYWAIVMGLFFIVFFNIIGVTAKIAGVSVATVSNKLSLIIPFLLSVFFLNATYNGINIVGGIVAITAVFFTCFQPQSKTFKATKLTYILPAVLFLGSGLLDFLIKYATTQLMPPAEEYLFFIVGFATAFSVGASILIYQLITTKTIIAKKSVTTGIIIGVPNYFSFYFLVKFINSGLITGATAIPINNIAVVIGSAILAFLVVNEKLSTINLIGIGLAVLSIVLLAYN